MDIDVVVPDVGSRTAAIYQQLRAAILDGRLPPGRRLPSSRDLARQLGVARSTVTYVYERLAAEGFVVARAGAGTTVNGDHVPATRPPRRRSGALRPRARWSAPDAWEAGPPRNWDVDLGVGIPDGSLFPHEAWRRHVARELRATARRPASYGPVAGSDALREAIARHIGVSRGVAASAADVIVTRGAQQAVDLIGRVLIEPGDVVVVEDPGYPPARDLFASLGAAVVPVPVDDEGLVVDHLPDGARAVHVTPSHQFPLGVPMSLRRRTDLLAWASARGAAVIEDDYDSEFPSGRRPLEPLQHLDVDGRVVYVGSFSKTLLPSLRLGFLVAPASLGPALVTAKRLSDGPGDAVAQRALARFIDRGDYARHLRRIGRVYATRREQAATSLDEHLATWFERLPAAAGLHLTARRRAGAAIDLAAALTSLEGRGVHIEPLTRYAATPTAPDGIVVGVGAATAPDIDRALRMLADELR